MKAPRIKKGYADGGETIDDKTPKRKLDVSKSSVVQGKTKEDLLKEGWNETTVNGKTYYFKENETGPTVKPRNPNITAPVNKNIASVGNTNNPTVKPRLKTTPPSYSQQIVELPPTTKPLQTQPDVQIDRQLVTRQGDLPYKVFSYPHPEGGYSQATERAFYEDPTTGKPRQINEFESMKTGKFNPVYSFPEGDERGDPTYGTLKNRSLNTGSVLPNDLKALEQYNQSKNNAGDKNFSPLGETKRQGFKKGGIVKAPKGIKGYANGNTVYDPNNPVSGQNQLNPGGTQFQTQGDAPLTSAQSGEKKGANIGNLGSALGNSLGWYQYANQAQQMARANVDKESVVDPQTGQVVTRPKSYMGGIVEQTAKPAHEKILEAAKSGDITKLGQLDPTYNFLIGKSKQDNAYNQAKYRADVAAQNEQNIQLNAAQREKALADRNAGVTMSQNSVARPNMVQQPKEELNPLQKVGSRLGFKNVSGLSSNNFAEGGKIEGKGGPKDDAIVAKVKEGSFVVPAENSDKAEMLRKMVLKKAPNVKANLNQKNGTKVRLSDGEHLFSKSEAEQLEKKGIDIHKLAPNAEDDMSHEEFNEIAELHMKHGGELSAEKAKIMLRDNQANGRELSRAQKKYFGWVAGGRK